MENSAKTAAERLGALVRKGEDQSRRNSLKMIEAAVTMERVYREQKEEIARLSARVAALEGDNRALESDNRELQASVDVLARAVDSAAEALSRDDGQIDALIGRLRAMAVDHESCVGPGIVEGTCAPEPPLRLLGGAVDAPEAPRD